MKIETMKVRVVTLTETDIRIALCNFAGLPVGSQVKTNARTDGQIVSATVTQTTPVDEGNS